MTEENKRSIVENTMCKECIKSDVCKYRNDYENTVKLLNNSDKISDHLTIAIHCKYYRGNVAGYR